MGCELLAIFVMRYIPKDIFPEILEIRAHLQWWKEDRQKQTHKAILHIDGIFNFKLLCQLKVLESFSMK